MDFGKLLISVLITALLFVVSIMFYLVYLKIGSTLIIGTVLFLIVATSIYKWVKF